MYSIRARSFADGFPVHSFEGGGVKMTQDRDELAEVVADHSFQGKEAPEIGGRREH